MCGIAGLLYADRARPAESEIVQRMCDALVHRGPDGEGFWVRGPVGLGMRRLAIIDVAGGDQPIFNEDGSIVVFQNGEIYNYVELRRELETLGHVFRTQSDTEVLAHAYEAWGDAFVEHLNGMWAIALWDAKRHRLFLSRDRLGIKPLHYAWDGERLVFGSEIKALVAAGMAVEPNWEVLDAYLAFGFVPEPHSFYHGVLKLPPGCNLVVDPGAEPRIERYWEIPIVDESDARHDEARIVEEFDALFSDAVRLQMRSDVPFGAFLSGGLDSASIVALMASQATESVKTFTMGFEIGGYDERDLARAVASRYRTDHVERVVEPQDLGTGLAAIGHAFDEPFGDSSALATWLVAGIARERVAVVLTGDGGDEVLSGYTRYQGEKFSQSWGRLPRLLRHHLVPRSVNAAEVLLSGTMRDRARRVARVVEAANLDFSARITSKQSWSSAATRARLLQGPFKSVVRPAREYVDEALAGCPARDNFHRLSWFDFKLTLPSQMLTKVDRVTMARSLEARVPFLDHRVVELLAPVSAAVKLPGYTRKHILRRAVGARLPPELLAAPKRGFNVPMREWFRDQEPTSLLQSHMTGEFEAIVRPDAVHELIAAHRDQRDDHGTLFWILLQMANWLERAGTVAARV